MAGRGLLPGSAGWAPPRSHASERVRPATGQNAAGVMDTIEIRRVPTAGPTLSVRDRPGGDPAVLGLPSNARWWDLVGADLAPAHRVLAIDLRGHGQSDRPENGYDFDTVVGD